MCEFYLNKPVFKMGKNSIYLTEAGRGLKGIMYVNHPACFSAPELVAIVITTMFRPTAVRKPRSG